MASDQKLRIFLSSPGDVAEERTLAREAIAELQREPQFEAATLEPVSWDDPHGRTPLVAQLDPQTAVERGLPKPSQCDVVVGIFWARMGSLLPTERYTKRNGQPYLSGTEYELENAFGAQPGPDVLLYQRAEPPHWDGRDRDLWEKKEQLDRMDAYLQSLKAAPRYVDEYLGPSDFKDRLKNDLRKVLARRLRSADGALSATLPMDAAGTGAIWRGSPYPGLRAFSEEEAPVFFGRGTEIDALFRHARHFDSGLLAVIGASGSGKSSLVYAGLIPRLRANALVGSKDWVIITFKPGELGADPFLPLATELQRLLPRHQQAPAVRDLAAELAERPEEIGLRGAAVLPVDRDWARLVLVIDQFEELFTLATADRQPKFIELLAHAAAHPKLFVVVTMRADFLDEASRDERLAELLRGNFPLAAPGAAALVEAIRRPAEQAGVEAPQDLVDAILNDVGTGSGALPLVAFCLSELWPQDEGARPRLTLDAYDELGRLRGAIERRAGQIVGRLGKPERDALPDLFQHLVQVSPDGTATRRRVRKLQLDVQPSRARLVQALVDGRLLLTSGEGLKATVEAAHEALFDGWPELHEWLEANRGLLLVRGQVLADQQRWDREGHDEELLLPPGRRLEEAMRLLERRPDLLLDGMAEFIQLSKQSADAARAQRQEELARWSRQLVARAREQSAAGDAVTAMLLALEALPQDLSQPERPLVSEAVVALDDAYRQAREHAVLRGHEHQVLSATFSPDGAKVVTASEDGTARLWDTVSGRELAVLRGHEGWVSSAAFSRDGDRVVTASEDRTARLWDTVGGQELTVLRGHEGVVLSAEFSPDGANVVTASSDCTARLWGAASGRELAVLRGHEQRVQSAAFGPGGAKVVTAAWDRTSRLWDTTSGQELTVLRGHEEGVLSAALSPDGAKVVTASTDATARLWDALSGRELAVLRHEGPVWKATFSADGAKVVTASWDRTSRLWDTASGQELTVLPGHKERVLSAVFGPDRAEVVTASEDGTARLWDAASGQELAVLDGHESVVFSAAFSPDGAKVVTASGDCTARLWQAARGEELVVLRGHEERVLSATFSPDGAEVVTASEDRTARLWEAVSGRELAILRHKDAVRWATFSPDGANVVTASWDRTARLWDTASGRELRPLGGYEDVVWSAGFSPDRAKVVTTSADRTARLWDADSGQELAVLRGHKGWVSSAAFSRDGAKVVTASEDGTARLWDAVGGRELVVLRGHDDEVRSAAFSPDGVNVITVSADRTARLWDADSGQELAVLRGHEGVVLSAAFSPDGAKVVTTSSDRTARIWRVFRSVDELVNAARARLPRQLTPAQRLRFFLPDR